MKEEFVLVHWGQTADTSEEGGKNDLWLFNFTNREVQSLNDDGNWKKHETLLVWDSPENIVESFPDSAIIDRWVQEV